MRKIINVLEKYDKLQIVFNNDFIEIKCYNKEYSIPIIINLSFDYKKIIKIFILRKQLEGKNLTYENKQT